MDKTLKILFLEDVIRDAELNWREIEKNGIAFKKLLVDNRKDFIEGLKSFKPDIIISDYSLPQFDGMQALLLRNELAPQTPFIVVTGSVNEEVAVECMKAGADNYVIKEHLIRLSFAVKESLEQYKIQNEKRAAELLLKEKEEKLQSIFSAAPVGIGFLIDQVFIEINDTFCKITGYNRNELIGKNAEILYAKDEQDENAGIVIFRHLTENGTGSVETRFKCKDGRILNIFFSAAPLDKDDLSKGVTFIAMDLTERKRSEEALRESEEKFRSIMENSADAIFIADQKGNYVYTNKEVTAILGYTSEEMKKKTIIDLAPQNKTDEYFEIFKKVLIEGRVFAEIELLKKDGNFISTDLNSVLLPGGLVYGSCRDISERNHAKEELIKAKDKAEESDRLKTAFLHNISHEIRTPMNAIVGFTALLGEPGVDAQTSKSYIEVIMQSSNNLLAIVSDIVDISNIEANIIKIVKNEINFNSTLNSICKQFLPAAGDKEIQLICESRVPDSDAFVITDNAKLTQILSNLINNAIKFTDKGYVKVGCRRRDKFLEFYVSDTGIGIPEEFHQKIFDRFYQVQNTISRLYEGTGLGLSISKAYVELLGGKIWLKSEPGAGTSFHFTIPDEKQNNTPLPVIEKPADKEFAFAEKKLILVAEDNDSNFKLLRFFLSGTNSDIIRAVNGKEAVEECLSNKNIDLILMDIKMPEMDGYTAVKLIREANITIPIIAQTAYIDERKKAIEVGFTGFISKPFDKKSLLQIISEFI